MSNYVNPPEKLISWLCYEESLTEKLKDKTGDASIHVLGHQLCIPSAWERNVLGIQDPLEFVREIVMFSGETRCWYARTIAPDSTYQANKPFFSRLEQNSLNIMLFHEKLATRQTLDCYSISKNELEFSWVKSLVSSYCATSGIDNLTLWVRRSCFMIGGKMPFYLIEIFLPEFLDLLA